MPVATWKQRFRRRLLAWFANHQRAMPWRQSRDAYRVWISEIMLQQTQVVTVIPYFERFLRSFPTVAALAQADEADVLRHWEGLGYYRRARQLHAAAKVVAAEHAGVFPRELAAIRNLPGIGRYTAGAIASIAFDVRAPILEANTVRLLSRLLAYRGDPHSTTGQELLWQMAEALLPAQGAGTLNQALMELGSLVCTPRSPACGDCPVRELCPTFELGLQAEIPRLKRPKQIEAVREAAVVIDRRGKVLVRQRTTGERWAGMWDFPRFAIAERRGAKLVGELAAKVRELVGITIVPGARLTTLRHGVTRFRIELECFAATYSSGKLDASHSAEVKWLTPKNLENYPLSVTARKLARLLVDRREPE